MLTPFVIPARRAAATRSPPSVRHAAPPAVVRHLRYSKVRVAPRLPPLPQDLLMAFLARLLSRERERIEERVGERATECSLFRRASPCNSASMAGNSLRSASGKNDSAGLCALSYELTWLQPRSRRSAWHGLAPRSCRRWRRWVIRIGE